jgi:hypothetical protein
MPTKLLEKRNAGRKCTIFISNLYDLRRKKKNLSYAVFSSLSMHDVVNRGISLVYSLLRQIAGFFQFVRPL